MTTDIEIKAGLSVDWAVKEALGVESCCHRNGVVQITSREWDELRGIEHHTCEGDVAYVPFQPSTDLNAAFAAAEAVGLWKHHLLAQEDEGWEVWSGEGVARRLVLATGSAQAVGVGSTPALAICAAILKLKEDKHAS